MMCNCGISCDRIISLRPETAVHCSFSLPLLLLVCGTAHMPDITNYITSLLVSSSSLEQTESNACYTTFTRAYRYYIHVSHECTQYRYAVPVRTCEHRFKLRSDASCDVTQFVMTSRSWVPESAERSSTQRVEFMRPTWSVAGDFTHPLAWLALRLRLRIISLQISGSWALTKITRVIYRVAQKMAQFFENRLIFDEVKAYQKTVPFFGPPCTFTMATQA